MKYALLLLLVAVASAQDAVLSGRVEVVGVGEPGQGGVQLKLESTPAKTYTARLDHNGTYRFKNLSGGEYTLEYREGGFRWITIRSIGILEGEQKTLPLLEAQVVLPCTSGPYLEYTKFLSPPDSPGALGATVRAIEGPLRSAPLEGAEVTLACAGCPMARTNSSGGFHLEGVRPGVYSLHVQKQGFYPEEFKEYWVREGRNLMYGAVYLEPCPGGDCDPKKRPPKPLAICE